MLKNYFTIAWRSLRKNKIFSIINILGLSLGIASAMLIIFHVREELSYDHGFPDASRIYRVTLEGVGSDTRHWAATSPVLASAIQENFPEVEKTIRFQRPYPYQVFSYTPVSGPVKRFEEKGGFFADSTAISVFGIQFVEGDPASALTATDGIIITEAMAKKYFGSEDALGKSLQDDMKKLPLKITGVIKEFGFHTHLQFDYLISMPTIEKYQNKESLESRGWSGFYTYVLVGKHQSESSIEKKFPEFLVKFFEAAGENRKDILANRRLHFQPIAAIHLRSKLEKEMYPNSDITYVYIFSIAALFILLIAAVNFINISTAQAFSRMKEIGLRKVVGSTKGQLILQFLGESLLITLLSTVLAVILFKSAIPLYNNLTMNQVHFTNMVTLSNAGLILGLVLVIGLLAGIYPAWFVARFNPVTALKGKKDSQSSVNLVRKGLIVFQFVVSVFMIFSTIIIYRQMKLFHTKNLGFDKEQVIAVTLYRDMQDKFESLTNQLEKNSAVVSYSSISTLPGERFGMYGFQTLSVSPNEILPDHVRVMWADEKLLQTLQISLKEGRNFFKQPAEIRKPEFILNEAAVKAYQLKDPIGRRMILEQDTGDVVGVVKDFNFASLHSQIEPLVIQYNPYRANYLLVKVQPNQIQQTLQFMEATIRNLSPSSKFSYAFIDEKLNQLYASENRMSQVFKAFSAFAIFISCLGLFGLSAYAAQLRIREIGVRKVLGASVTNVTILLSRDFMKLVLLAIFIAWPLAWWAMQHWLDGFSFHISIEPGLFIISGAAALAMALLTVSYQAIKAALVNPVTSLKSE